jgi:hypothetical protein
MKEKIYGGRRGMRMVVDREDHRARRRRRWWGRGKETSVVEEDAMGKPRLQMNVCTVHN